jgi:hypothetical protein
VVILAEHDGTEVPVVPSQDPGTADRSHRHDGEVGQVDSGVGVSVGKIEGEPQLGVGGCVESVNALKQGAAESNGGRRVASSTKQQIDLSEDGPWDNYVAGGSGQQLGGEPMASTFASVQRRDQRTGVADDQPASRASTSSTRWERSSSSSTTPAYGSGSGCWETSSVTKDENEVLRRSASRSRRAATAGGSEMVRRTVAILGSMNCAA